MKQKYSYRQGKGLKIRKARLRRKEMCNETEITKLRGDVTSHILKSRSTPAVKTDR